MTKQNKTLVTVLIIVAVVIAGYFIWKNQAAAPSTQTNSNATVTPGTTPGAAANKNTSVGSASYTQAIEDYAGFRFQFVGCSGTPGSITVKAGQKFMLDNRDTMSHVFTVNGVKYTVAGQSYAIASSSKVGANNILCDGGGAASLNVEK